VRIKILNLNVLWKLLVDILKHPDLNSLKRLRKHPK
jgi:hypothetical protein